MQDEVWKDIEGYEGYQVSSEGRIRSLDREVLYNNGTIRIHRGRILKPSKINSGYLSVSLGRNCKFLVHRIVAKTFLNNHDNLPCINHKNNDRTDNRLSNLEYCSYHYNNTYGTHKQLQRESHISNLENNKRAKPVNQYSLDNEYIKTFLSARRASEELNVCHSGIIRCCNGQSNTCKGFRWSYAPLEAPNA